MSALDYKEYGANYSREELVKIVAKQMSEKRFEHVLRVEETAIKLAKIYHVDSNMVSLAALLHDYGKERPDKDYLKLIEENPKYQSLTPYGNNIWHGILGALLVRDELQIENEEVLHAIKVHTTGAIFMNLLDKIIFIADYIEPGRSFQGIDEVRDLAYSGKLDEAIALSLVQTLQFLIKKRQIIFPYTIEVYNHFVNLGGN